MSRLRGGPIPARPFLFHNTTLLPFSPCVQGAGGHRDVRFRPVFVVGLPRSGSTLIEQVLASHSQVRPPSSDRRPLPVPSSMQPSC